MATLHIPVALPGAGKTTWAKRVLSYAEWISSDDIRNRLFPGAYNPENNEKVFKHFHDIIDNCLDAGMDVVADATNLEARARRKLYYLAMAHDADIHVILFQNVQQALERNAARDGNENGTFRVPEEAMLQRMIPRYEQTLSEIDSEPFTYITRIESVG